MIAGGVNPDLLLAGKYGHALHVWNLRDGRRVYVSNSLYASWDAQFYPEGIHGWVAKLDADPAGGLSLDPAFVVTFEGERPHQIRLQGGDASSDSYCFPSS